MEGKCRKHVGFNSGVSILRHFRIQVPVLTLCAIRQPLSTSFFPIWQSVLSFSSHQFLTVFLILLDFQGWHSWSPHGSLRNRACSSSNQACGLHCARYFTEQLEANSRCAGSCQRPDAYLAWLVKRHWPHFGRRSCSLYRAHRHHQAFGSGAARYACAALCCAVVTVALFGPFSRIYL